MAETYSPPYPKLENAPIIEALIDIHAQLSPHSSLAEMEKILPDNFKQQYPHREEQKQIEASFAPNPVGELTVSGKSYPHRILLRDKEAEKASKVIQIRLDGFALSHLAPYRQFKNLCQETKDGWNLFERTYKPVRVNKVSLIYINMINCDREISRREDYLSYILMVPPVPVNEKFLLKNYGGYSSIYSEEKDVSVSVNIQTMQHVSKKTTGIQLMIQASYEFNESPSNQALWEKVDVLQEVKNNVFFGLVPKNQINTYNIQS